MIQEGFFANIGAAPFSGLRRAFTQAISGSVIFKNEPSLKKHVPGAQVRINDKNILPIEFDFYMWSKDPKIEEELVLPKDNLFV